MGSDKEEDVSVTVVRKINASASEVYAAWIEPDLIAEWFASGEDFVTSASVDPRCGGNYRIEGQHAGGEAYLITGSYLDLVEDRRIVMSWIYDGPVESLKGDGSLVIAELRKIDPHLTELTLTHRKKDRHGSAEILRKAWDSCVDKLISISKNTR